MDKGFDCFSPVTEEVAQRATAAGMRFVCRYYGPASSGKLLKPAEARLLSDMGLRIVTVFERYPGRPLESGGAAYEDAHLALTQAVYNDQSRGSTIIFAVDKDVDTNQSVTRNFLLGYFGTARDIIQDCGYTIGAYGSGAVLELLQGSGLIAVSWLAGAMGWRGSHDYNKSGRWHLRQGSPTRGEGSPANRLGTHSVGADHIGIEYDPNDAVSLDKIGGWSLAAIPPKPPITDEIDIAEMQGKLQRLGFYRGKIDGNPGPQTAKALSDYYYQSKKRAGS